MATDYNIIKAKDPKTKHKSHLSVNLNLKEILHKSEYRKMSNNFTLKRSLCPNSNKTLITAQNAIKDSPIKESKTDLLMESLSGECTGSGRESEYVQS